MVNARHGFAPAAMHRNTALCSRAFFLLGVLGFSLPSPAQANPQGGQVAAGQASITSSGNTLNVTQSTDKAVIDWRSFNIAADERTAFHQPSSSAMALNRVNDLNPSQILGTLTANGHVVLVNPNGVFFGPSAKIDVAGLVATTANIANNDFLAGKLNFNQPGNPQAAIINQGTITAQEAGLVGLVAPVVENEGVITAKLGQVTLASGDSFTLDMAGDHLIEVAVTSELAQQLASNSGKIAADGGTVMLTAAAGRQLVDGVVSNSGAIEANSIGGTNGHIVLYAEGGNAVPGNVEADKSQVRGSSTAWSSGMLSASGSGSGAKGGTIEVLGDQVGLRSGSVLDVSGDAGGGTVRVGGDFHGQGTTPTALATVVQNGATINADARGAGNGGRVAVWSDSDTSFEGLISARGGLGGGNGGYVETSGKQILNMQGMVDASATQGQAGAWLMDPADAVIGSSDSNETGSAGSTSFTPDGTAATAFINAADIDASLNHGTSVTVATGGDSASGSGGGAITVASDIAKTAGSGATLTLSAATDIVVNNNVSISSTSGKLNTLFDANTAGNGGAIVLNPGATIASNGGDIYLGGGTLDGSGHPSGSAVGDAANPSGINLSYPILNSGSGNIVMSGTGYAGASGNDYGILMSGFEASPGVWTSGIMQTTTGNITLNGTGGNSTNSNYGVWLGVALVTTQNGAIAVNGAGAGNGYANYGIYNFVSSVQATGTGSITLSGTAPATGTFHGVGVDIEGTLGGSPVISSVNGNIAITGTGQGWANEDNAGITLYNNPSSTYYPSIYTTGTGHITLTGISGNGNPGIYARAGTVQIGGGSDSGNITLNADTLSLDDTATTAIQTSGTVLFAPYTAGATIGFSGGAGTLQVTQAILDAVNAPTVTVGSTSAGALTTGAFNWEHTLDNLNLIGGSVEVGGNITKGVDDASVANSASGTLTVQSNTDITQDSNAAIASSGSYGKLNTLFDADVAGGEGAILMNTGSSITTNGGDIYLGGGTLDGSDHPTGAAVGDNVASGMSSGVWLYGATLTAGAGNVSLYGSGTTGPFGTYDNGILVWNSSSISTTTGNITLNGFGSTSPGPGVWGHDIGVFVDSSSQISTVSGAVGITGTGYGNIELDHGVVISGDVLSTGTGSGVGSITIKGTGSAHAIASNGVEILAGANITSVDANIAITGTAPGNTAGSDNNGINIGIANDAGIQSNAGGAVIASTGKGNIMLTATGGGDSDIGDLYYFGGAPGNVSTIGNAAGTGTITFNADTLLNPLDIQVQTAGQVVFQPRTASTTVGVAGGAGTLQLTSGLLNNITAGGISIGNTADSGAMNVGAYAWNAPVSLLSGRGSIDIGGAQAMGGNSFLADTVAGNITLDSVASIASTATGNAITLADSGGHFLNAAGSDALWASKGRWLVYSTTPAGDVLGGLNGTFLRFSCSYGGSCPRVPSTGNGLLYRAMLPGTVSKGSGDPVLGLPGFPVRFPPVGPMDFADLITMDHRIAADQASPFLLDAGQ